MIDKQKMLEVIQGLPGQLESAWTSLWTKDIPWKGDSIKQVLIAGMGGSGFVGRLVADLFVDSSKVPIVNWADYGLPGWADKHTLIIAISYSGETEETISSAMRAKELGAPLIVIATGGKLASLATAGFLKADIITQPRLASGWLLGLTLTILTKLKLIPLTEESYFKALDELKIAVEKKAFLPKAEQLAIGLNNKIPLILAHHPLGAVAYRFATDMNENSKTFAVSGQIPEMCHNLLVGLDFPNPDKLSVIILESKFGFSRNVARKAVLEKTFAKKEIGVTPIAVKSGSPLAESLLFTYFGGLLSYYLAGVNGIDPTPVEIITHFKRELASL